MEKCYENQIDREAIKKGKPKDKEKQSSERRDAIIISPKKRET